jgi:hypothetical protein
MAAFRRFFRRNSERSAPPTAEGLFEQALGIGQLPRDERHPARSDEARQEVANSTSERILARCDELRAAGLWTQEMDALSSDLADAGPDNPQNSERVATLAKLVNGALRLV